MYQELNETPLFLDFSHACFRIGLNGFYGEATYSVHEGTLQELLDFHITMAVGSIKY